MDELEENRRRSRVMVDAWRRHRIGQPVDHTDDDESKPEPPSDDAA